MKNQKVLVIVLCLALALPLLGSCGQKSTTWNSFKNHFESQDATLYVSLSREEGSEIEKFKYLDANKDILKRIDGHVSAEAVAPSGEYVHPCILIEYGYVKQPIDGTCYSINFSNCDLHVGIIDSVDDYSYEGCDYSFTKTDRDAIVAYCLSFIPEINL
jgi:hypothetical protein